MVGAVLVWLAVKIIFVEVVVPARNAQREPRAKGQQLAALVPEGKTLYLFRLKDEGIMFYYGRSVRRLTDPEQLPLTGEPLYAIMEQEEWKRWNRRRPAEVVHSLRDEQGAPVVLIRVSP